MAILGSWLLTNSLVQGSHNLMGTGTATDALIWGGYNSGSRTEKFNGSTWSTTGAFASSYPGGASFGGSASSAQHGAGYNVTNGYRFNGTTWSSSTTYPALVYNINGTGTVSAGLTTGWSGNVWIYNGSSYTATGSTTVGVGTCAFFGSTSAATYSDYGTSKKFNGSTWSATGAPVASNRLTAGGFGVMDLGITHSGAVSGDTDVFAYSENFNGTSWATDSYEIIGTFAGNGNANQSTTGGNGLFAGGRVFNNSSVAASQLYVLNVQLDRGNQTARNNAVVLRYDSTYQKISTDFTPSVTAPLYRADFSSTGTGGFGSGTFFMEIRDDNGGLPGNLLATSQNFQISINNIWSGGNTLWYGVYFPTPATLTAGVKYHLCWCGTWTIDGSHYLIIQCNSTPAAGGQAILRQYNGTTWSIFGATRYLMYREFQFTEVIPAITASDSTTVTEAVTVDPPFVPPPETHQDETVTVTENVAVEVIGQPPDLDLTFTDTVTVSESKTIAVSQAQALFVTVSDSVTVSDTPTAEVMPPNLLATTSDSVVVSEALDFKAPFEADLEVHVVESKFPNGYYYRKDVTLTKSQFVDGVNNTWTNVTVLVTGNYPELKTKANGGSLFSSNGYDINFTDTSDTNLAFTFEKLDLTTGDIVAWVMVPTVNTSHNSTSTVIRMYYGKPNTGSSPQYPSGVFLNTSYALQTNKHSLVYHFANNFTDSSPSNHTATNSGTTFVAGKHANGIDFDASSNTYIDAGDYTDINRGEGFFLGGWVKFSANDMGHEVHLFSKWNGSSGYYCGKDANDRLFYYIGSPSSQHDTAYTQYGVCIVDTWYYVLFSFAGVTSRTIHINGFNYGVTGGNSDSISGSNGGHLYLGRGLSGNYFDGQMDEIRYEYATPESPSVGSEASNLINPLAVNAEAFGDGVIAVSETITNEIPIDTVSASDTVTVSETFDFKFQNNVTVEDAVIVTDEPTIYFPSPFPTPNVHDNVTVSESVSVAALTGFAHVSDTTTVSEAVTIGTPFTVPLSLAVSDSVTVTEFKQLSAPDENVVVSDSVGVTDIAEAVLSADLRALETVAALENVTISVSDLQIYASDTISTSESVGNHTDLALYASDTITISEYVNLIPPIEVYAFDATAIFDNPTMIAPLEIGVSEIVSTIDEINPNVTLDVNTSDSITYSESFGGYNEINLYEQDIVSATDFNAIIVREPPVHKPITLDTVTVGEGEISISIIQVGALAFSTSDVVHVNEGVINAVTPFPPVYVSDSVTVSDFPSAVTPTVLFVHASDTVVVHDTVTPYDMEFVIPPTAHFVHVYDVIVVTETHVVDRDIWGANLDETGGWTGETAPTTTYKEVADPTTVWTEIIEHER